MDFVENLKLVHAQTRDKLMESTARYKLQADKKRRDVEFDVGDFVWAVLPRERYPAHEYNKSSAKKIGPVEIIEKVNPNAYRLKLPSHIRTADAFTVKHLRPFVDDSSSDDMASDSRANRADPGGDDGEQEDDIQERASGSIFGQLGAEEIIRGALPTSNGHNFCIRCPFWAHKYFSERTRRSR